MIGPRMVEAAESDGRRRLFLKGRPDDFAPFHATVGDGSGFPLCVFSGVDSLALYYPPGPVDPEWFRLLDSAKAAAQDPENKAGHIVVTTDGRV